MGDNEKAISNSVLTKDTGRAGRNGRTDSCDGGTESSGEIKRRSNGTFAGGPLTEEFKKLISEGQIARHERIKAERVDEPTLKRCTKCEGWKDRKDDFPQRKRKLASGVVVKYPSGECKKCKAEISAAWRSSKGAAEMKKLNKKYSKSRNKKKQRKYQREYGRIRRNLDGAKTRGPWSKYKNEHELDRLVPRAPFDDALSRVNLTINELHTLTGYDEGLFRHKDRKFIKFSVVDNVFTKLGMHDQVSVQFPPD